MSEPVQPSAARLELDAAEANLGNARIALNDWVNCSTQEQLARWRQAQRRLIAAAKRVGALEVQPSAAPALDKEERFLENIRIVDKQTFSRKEVDHLLAIIARLSAVQITEVQLPDGRPVAAPCGIDGCQYEELARQRVENSELRTLAKIGTWHNECRPNRHQAAREIEKSQAVINKLADTITRLGAEVARLRALQETEKEKA